MKIYRFESKESEVLYGTNFDGRNIEIIQGDPYSGFIKTGKSKMVEKILTPLIPTNILCIGLNYKAHIEETSLDHPDFPVLFMKNTSSLLNPDGCIVIPEPCRDEPEIDFEGELAVVIGKDAKNVKRKDAKEYIAGYTIGNDISARITQFSNGGQWIRGKSFDTFCPLGPCMVTDIDPEKLRISTILNGEIMQDSDTSHMIFSVYELIELLSEGMTLSKGTVILTGTPSGVGFTRKPPVFLKNGDVIEVTVENIGTLKNTVKDN